eukprot:265358-Amphidinium_carterae.1
MSESFEKSALFGGVVSLGTLSSDRKEPPPGAIEHPTKGYEAMTTKEQNYVNAEFYSITTKMFQTDQGRCEA